ncbi:MAG: permease [Deltaproteobacteria bacterium]|nr:permease [Deltaproteobacteria bacterium]
MSPSSDPCCHESPRAASPGWGKRFLGNKLLLIGLADLLLYSSGFVFPPLRPFQESFRGYLRMIWWALAFGFLLAGVIDRYIPTEYVSKILARPSKKTILYASGLGVLMSACSHGILAIAIELHRKGASGPAVISFLLGSPWANLPVTLLLIGFFHGKGLVIIGAALGVAITTGLLLQLLDRWGWIETNKNTAMIDPDFSIRTDLYRRWQERQWDGKTLISDAREIFKGAVAMANMIGWWLLLGITLAGLISAFVPSHLFHTYLGPSLTGLLLTLAAATVIEVCSEGSAPLAFEIYRQTGAFGNTFTFLMGGVVTDYTEIGLVWTNLGWKTSLWMVALTVPQVLLIGWLMNQVF